MTTPRDVPRARVDGRKQLCSGWKRSIPRLLLRSLAVALLAASPAQAQLGSPFPSPGPIGGVPLVLAEHGDPTLAIPFAASVAGLAIYDIATAGASAQSSNARAAGGYRSPRTAFTLSLVATVAPVVAGMGAASASGAAGALLIGSGIVLGPSMGHWYAEKTGRGLLTAALRAGIGLVAGMTALAAS